ncbi:hypothetical protein pb186bvf_019301 [Paramecium bursaria]
MSTARIPFQSQIQNISKQEPNKDSKESHSDAQDGKKTVEQFQKEFKIQNEPIFETLEREQLLCHLKQYRYILSICFDENDQLRQRVQEVEAEHSYLQDKIEERDNVILELNEIIQKYQN